MAPDAKKIPASPILGDGQSRAMVLAPKHTVTTPSISLGRYQEALAASEKIIAKRPAWIMARILNVLALHGLGNEAEACDAMRALLEISPRFSAGRWRRIIFYPDRPDVPDLVGRLVSAGLPS